MDIDLAHNTFYEHRYETLDLNLQILSVRYTNIVRKSIATSANISMKIRILIQFNDCRRFKRGEFSELVHCCL